MANCFFKWLMCAFVAKKSRLIFQVGLLFSVPVVVGALLLGLWPDK
jgi:hypothetical protein